jgi:hypothetical protein
MKTKTILAAILAALLAIAHASAMNNNDVIKMAQSEIDQSAIIAAIESTAAPAFDTSRSGLIALLNAKVPDAVIAAIEKRAAGGTKTAAAVAQPQAPQPAPAAKSAPAPKPAPAASLPPGDSLARPKEGRANYYFSLGGVYEKANGASDDHYGAFMGFAANFGRHHKAGIDISGFMEKEEISISAYPYSLEFEQKFMRIPLLLSYNYCLLFGSRDRFEVHFGPVAGAFWYSFEGKSSGTGGNHSFKTSKFGYGYGGEAGFTWHFSQRVFLDATVRSVRYDLFSPIEYTIGPGYNQSFGAVTLKTATVSIGFKF